MHVMIIQLTFLLCFLGIIVVDGQSCNCDLVQELCDLNCCCDNDCSPNDTLIFSTCTTTSTNPANFLCSFDQTSFVNNLQVVTKIQSNSLFCVETDNFAERNFYSDPPCILDNTCFNAVESTYSFVSPAGETATVAPTTFYTNGDTIFIRYSNGVQSIFTISTNGITSTCQDNDPVIFYTNRVSTCTRTLTSIASSCTSTDSLNFATYAEDFQFYAAPPTNSSLGLVNITIASCKIDGVEFGDSCVGPVLSAGTCDNVVTAVTYLITTDGFNGIVASTVSFVLERISSTDLPLSQTFSVTFQSLQSQNTQNTQVLEKNGNPGYLVGKPLTAAAREQGDTTIAPLNVSQTLIPGLEISLINPDSSGMCSSSFSQPRLPVLFGNDVRIGCLAQVAGTTCAALQDSIRFVLDGPTFSAFNGTGDVFVGTFGDSSIHTLATLNSPSDWVKVVRGTYSALPTNDMSGCAGMVLSSRYEILYGNSGSITNPQAKILGVRYSYGDPQFFRFQCLRGSCSNIAATQKVEVYTSVNFIDISQTPVSIQRERPRVIANLPSDFFFPLKSSSNSPSTDAAVVLSCLMMMTLAHKLFNP